MIRLFVGITLEVGISLKVVIKQFVGSSYPSYYSERAPIFLYIYGIGFGHENVSLLSYTASSVLRTILLSCIIPRSSGKKVYVRYSGVDSLVHANAYVTRESKKK